MARPASGQVRSYRRHDGSVTFSLRFRAYGERHTVTLGTDAEGWTQRRAQIELENTLAKVRAEIWAPPDPEQAPGEEPTFHVFASRWLKRRRHELRDSTYKDYRWRLVRHLLPFFADYRLSAITLHLVDDYRERKVEERNDLLVGQRAGVSLRDEDGRLLRPLSNESINKTLSLLAAILDDAVEKEWLVSNPAKGKRRRLKAKAPRRPFLEADELAALIEAAKELDRPAGASAQATQARRLRKQGLTFRQIGDALGTTASRAHYLVERARSGRDGGSPLIRGAIVATLGCAGLRASELCDLSWSDVDFAHRRLRITDAKTAAGLRDVDMTPRLADELLAYRALLGDVDPHAPAFPTRTGGRRDKDNLRSRVLAAAIRRADKHRIDQGLPPLPAGVSPHALRRTYISLMLEAGASVPYVMAQVGHVTPDLTLRIYAQVLNRSRRQVGEKFDQLMRDAVPEPAHAVSETV